MWDWTLVESVYIRCDTKIFKLSIIQLYTLKLIKHFDLRAQITLVLLQKKSVTLETLCMRHSGIACNADHVSRIALGDLI